MKEENLNKLYSPFCKLDVNICNCNFSIKRDDLLPNFLGGNKVRKNSYILSSMTQKPDVIITNGGSESNHARVCALMASQLGIKCHLVLHGKKASSSFMNGNSFFIDATTPVVEYVDASLIASSIDSAKRKYLSEGLLVEVIPGGAHSVEGALAYVMAIDELIEEPDFIVLASGTGATQAGLSAGVKKKGWKTKVIGISVARNNKNGLAAVDEIYKDLSNKLDISGDVSDLHFFDSYTFGGYAKYTSELIDFIKVLSSKTGVPFDPVYTGKAMFGMFDLIRNGIIPSGSDIVFWHTGGLLNLQSAENYLD